MAQTKTTKFVREEVRQALKQLGLTTGRIRSRHGKNPNAQSTEYNQSNNKVETKAEDVLLKVEELKSKSYQLYACAYLQCLHGLRISEVLAIRPTDITPLGTIRIQSNKGSNNRLVTSGEVMKYMLRCRSNSVFPFKDLDRYYVYREYRKIGLVLMTSTATHAKVTHIFRHMLVKTNQDQGFEIELSKNQLGHRSLKSTMEYDKR